MKHLLFAMIISIVAAELLAAGEKAKYTHDLSFAVPHAFWKNPDCVPASYLETFPIKKANARLSERQRIAIRNLFISAHDASKAKLHQDYTIATSTPIYRLLKANFPVVEKYEGEGGVIIFLGEIKKALATTMPPQRPQR